MSTVMSKPLDRTPLPYGTLMLTGYTINGRVLVFFDSCAVPLSRDQFDTLIMLAFKRRTTVTGRVMIDDLDVADLQHFRTKIARVRNALDEALGSSAGLQIITNGLPGEYHLYQSATTIYFDRSCLELPPGAISLNRAELLSVVDQITRDIPVLL